jgi:hypothetical protein
MLQERLSALAVLRAERAHQAERAQPLALISERVEQAIRDQDSVERPSRCQLGGSVACQKQAEAKVADSWGDSAWACWHHAEEALINVVPAFLATESPYGLAAHRARTAPDQTSH